MAREGRRGRTGEPGVEEAMKRRSGEAPRQMKDKIGQPASPGEPRSPQDRAFQRWVNEQLRKKYDPVLEEEIPEELLSLLRPRREHG